MKNKVKIIILAAGLGKRMQSNNPKVLTEIRAKRMIEHLRDTILKVQTEKPVAVIGYKAELVKAELGDSFVYVVQEEQLGTAHAVMMAEQACKDAENIMVLYGDQPFIKNETIKNILKKHSDSGVKITFATTEVPNFDTWYRVFSTFARILRDNDEIIGIREYKDSNESEKNIKELNAGCYAFNAKWLWENLKKIKNHNSQNEYYLTDLLPLALANHDKIESVKIDPKEAIGINSKEELEILEKFA